MRRGIIFILYLLLLVNCREPYQAPTILAQSDLLVVDGFLDGANGSCTVLLMRSQNVSDPNNPPAEKKAIVQLVDEKGNVYTLNEISDGNYSVSNVTIDTQIKYRLTIKTEAGQSYQSDYVGIKNTPPIDTVTWAATVQGLQFYVSTHDDEKKSIYYQYRFLETWEYQSALPSSYELENGQPVPRGDDIYHCWATVPSTEISIATSIKLSDDVISNFPFYLIPKPSKKYLIGYSILVKQSVLTLEAYNYWQQLQKNTEKIGTLFDPQPSQIQSNIQNVNNTNEPVLGYFSAGITTEKRIFVSPDELPSDWYFAQPNHCVVDTIAAAVVGYLKPAFLIVDGLATATNPIPYAYTYSIIECVDCRLAGGANTKPDFWSH